MSKETSKEELFFQTPLGPATRNSSGDFVISQEHLKEWYEKEQGIPFDTVDKVHEAELKGCLQMAKFLTPHVCAEDRPLEITAGRGNGSLSARVVNRYMDRGKANQGDPVEKFGRVKIGVNIRIPERERREGGTVYDITKSVRDALDTGAKATEAKKEATA